MVIQIIADYPRLTIIAFSLVITLISTLITKWLTNQEHLKSLKKRQKELQEELKKCKGDECRMKEINSEMMSIAGTMFKSSFKPLLITFIPFLLLFYWIRAVYVPIMGFSWFWYYLVASLVSSMVFRKVFDVA